MNLSFHPGAALVAEAVAETARLRPGALLMDLEMPALDGIEAIRRLLAADGALCPGAQAGVSCPCDHDGPPLEGIMDSGSEVGSRDD